MRPIAGGRSLLFASPLYSNGLASWKSGDVDRRRTSWEICFGHRSPHELRWSIPNILLPPSYSRSWLQLSSRIHSGGKEARVSGNWFLLAEWDMRPNSWQSRRRGCFHGGMGTLIERVDCPKLLRTQQSL